MKRWKITTLWITAVIIDMAVYMLLGLMMVVYDDKYNGPSNKYWDWDTLSKFDKAIELSLWTWNIVNIVIIASLIFRIVQKRRVLSEII